MEDIVPFAGCIPVAGSARVGRGPVNWVESLVRGRYLAPNQDLSFEDHVDIAAFLCMLNGHVSGSHERVRIVSALQAFSGVVCAEERCASELREYDLGGALADQRGGSSRQEGRRHGT